MFGDFGEEFKETNFALDEMLLRNRVNTVLEYLNFYLGGQILD